MESNVRFAPLNGQSPGTLASLLEAAYGPLLAGDSPIWNEERARWRRFDAEAFGHLDTVGRCVFLTWLGEDLVGFASYDPRQGPEVGVIGHHCVVPQFQRQGIGAAQVREILHRFGAMGVGRARATTLDIPFFEAARRTYTRCGFTETRRSAWDRDPTKAIIEYETMLGS